MARFYGMVGFETNQRETEPGIIKPFMEEKPYYGKVLKNSRRWEGNEQSTNDNVILSNRISIVCDAYMNDHWPTIKYLRWNNVNWAVTSMDIERPRIILTLGGVWNGNTP